MLLKPFLGSAPGSPLQPPLASLARSAFSDCGRVSCPGGASSLLRLASLLGSLMQAQDYKFHPVDCGLTSTTGLPGQSLPQHHPWISPGGCHTDAPNSTRPEWDSICLPFPEAFFISVKAATLHPPCGSDSQVTLGSSLTALSHPWANPPPTPPPLSRLHPAQATTVPCRLPLLTDSSDSLLSLQQPQGHF